MKRVEIEKGKLDGFIESLKQHFINIDAIMQSPESHERGKAVAREMNRLNYDFDVFRHFGLGIPLKKLSLQSSPLQAGVEQSAKEETYPAEFVEWTVKKTESEELSCFMGDYSFNGKIYPLSELYKFWQDNIQGK